MAMASTSEHKDHFSGEEDTKKFFHMCEHVIMKAKFEEENSNNLVAYLNGEKFEYYFDNFTEDNDPNEEVRSFQKVKEELLKKFLTQNTDVEV